jgi:hypothetical protein
VGGDRESATIKKVRLNGSAEFAPPIWEVPTKAEFCFQVPTGEASAFFTCPEKHVGMPVEAIQVLPISI